LHSVATLTISDLWVERGESDLLNGLSFSARSGDLVHITGANGAGKSTFFKALLGLLPILSGSMTFNGESLAQGRHRFLNNVLYIAHSAGLNSALSVLENLRWYAPDCTQDKIEQVLTRLSLAAFSETQLQALSAGQVRRVALARLWLSEKQIWLLDEPFTALDQTLIGLLEEKMAAHVASGGMIILASHLPLANLPYLQVELSP
jgi:heme exporter protein A